MDCQITNPLHHVPLNVIGLVLENVKSQSEVTGLLLRRLMTRISAQVHLAFEASALQVEGKPDQDQNRCPEDSMLSFAMCRRLRRQEHVPKQQSRWRQNPARENNQRSRSRRRSLALALLSTRIRSLNQSHKLNQPVAPLLFQFDQ